MKNHCSCEFNVRKIKRRFGKLYIKLLLLNFALMCIVFVMESEYSSVKIRVLPKGTHIQMLVNVKSP